MKRLPFEVPPFIRHSWVSDTAQAVWDERFRRISRRWERIERRSVTAGLRRCALGRIPERERDQVYMEARSSGLVAQDVIETGKDPRYISVVIGKREDVIAFQTAWQRYDHLTMGELLGYPICCTHFYQRIMVKEAAIDSTWWYAGRASQSAKYEDQTQAFKRIIAGASWKCNSLLHRAGIKALAHLPCSPDCQRSADVAGHFISFGQSLGYKREMGWLKEILNWPMEWSALHGIAEVRTPVFKLATHTDATADKLIVAWTGTQGPAEAAQGLNFPYRVPEFLRITNSKGFKRGMSQSESS